MKRPQIKEHYYVFKVIKTTVIGGVYHKDVLGKITTTTRKVRDVEQLAREQFKVRGIRCELYSSKDIIYTLPMCDELKDLIKRKGIVTEVEKFY